MRCVLAILALVLTASASHAGAATTIESPIARIARLSKLPEALTTLEPGERLVRFARGAVQLQPGEAWRVAELPYQRSLALVLTTEPLPDSLPKLREGMWLTYMPLEFDKPQAGRSKTAANELHGRIKSLYPNAKLEAPSTGIIADSPALIQTFQLPAERRLFAAPKAIGSENHSEPSTSRRGWHAFIAAESGQIELHVIATDNLTAEAPIAKLLATLKLGEPEPFAQEVPPALRSAERAIGSWKSPRALLEIAADGTICLTSDRKKAYELDRKGLVDYEKPQQVLEGEFTAEDDLLRIRWQDGSLLNIRWRLQANELLLTDHHGRVRRLTRLVR